MRITAVRIRNFRGIKSLDLEFGRVTVLIGENNSGKTSVLDALKFCLRDLGPRRRVVFDGLDFHLPDSHSEPSSADRIVIEVTFSDLPDEEWDDELVGRLNRARVLQIDDEERNHVRLRVTCKYDQGSREFAQEWSFLDLQGDPLSRAGPRALTVLQDEIRYYYLTALRDAARHFDARGPFWRPFLQDSQLSPDKKVEIEEKLREVNDLVVSSHTSFEQVQEFSQSDVGMLAKVANALGIPWYCVGDDDNKRTKVEPKLRTNLDSAEEVDRFVFPYPNTEVNLLRNGYVDIYRNYMPQQNLRQIAKAPGDPGYWVEYATKLPNRNKTRAAAEVAVEMEDRGSAGVPAEIRKVLKKVVGLSQGGHQ